MKTEIERYKQKIKNKDYFKETLMEKWTMKAKPYLSSSVKFKEEVSEQDLLKYSGIQ